MNDKYSYYDFLANIIPGLLVLSVLIWLFNVLKINFEFKTAEILGVGIGLAVAYSLGHVIQAISSFVQPIYYFLWGGIPSDNLLSGKSNMLGEYRGQIVKQLKDALDIGSSKEAGGDYKEVFSRAMAVVNSEKIGRVEAFNASYAFHRALLTSTWMLSSLLTIILILAYLNELSLNENGSAIAIVMILGWASATIEFFRTRQRGYYFAKEVIYCAYYHLTKSGGKDVKSTSH